MDCSLESILIGFLCLKWKKKNRNLAKRNKKKTKFLLWSLDNTWSLLIFPNCSMHIHQDQKQVCHSFILIFISFPIVHIIEIASSDFPAFLTFYLTKMNKISSSFVCLLKQSFHLMPNHILYDRRKNKKKEKRPKCLFSKWIMKFDTQEH